MIQNQNTNFLHFIFVCIWFVVPLVNGSWIGENLSEQSSWRHFLPPNWKFVKAALSGRRKLNAVDSAFPTAEPTYGPTSTTTFSNFYVEYYSDAGCSNVVSTFGFANLQCINGYDRSGNAVGSALFN